ncbi:MAG: methyltransferase domain-containing protein [Bacteroidales bacterium]|nr:methyltransferase domain-containing protein [Bacteroidales bacterium]
MHKESFEIMRYIVDTYLDKNKKLEILDVGSYDVNGSYKSLFQNPNWSYCGLDIVEGPNVDIVSKGLYDFGLDKQFDVVISGNCLEHVEAPWKWIQEVHQIVKKGGLVCIITPFSVPEHRYPIDCWRILPDGYRYLLEKESDFTILETRFNISKARYKFRNKKLTNRFAPKWLRKYYFKKVNIDDVFVVATKN